MKGLIVVNKETARKKYRQYLKDSRTNKEDYLKSLKLLYFHLSKGRKVMDIYEAFKFAGLNEYDEPRLAIVRADQKKVYFYKNSDGKGRFSFDSYSYGGNKFDVDIPKNIFPPEWEKDESLNAGVPIIPIDKRGKGKLDKYYILWDIEKWDVVPIDPFLLKRITKNLFIVIEKWNLTKLERALISGR